jgi:UDP-glucose 4-epimerase
MDLANAHVKALNTMSDTGKSITLNVGTGKGSSVLEAVQSFEKVNQLKLNYKIGPKRSGDIDQIYAATELAEKTLKWRAKYSLDDAMKDAWRWEKNLAKK